MNKTTTIIYDHLQIKMKKPSTQIGVEGLMAETERFELSIQFPIYTLSRRAPSATRTRLHVF